MAQLNITLNQEEILSLLKENSGDAFKKRYYSRPFSPLCAFWINLVHFH